MIIKLPDGTIKEYEEKKSVYDITKDISEGLARVALGALVNGEIKGMKEIVDQDSDFKVLKFEDKEGKQIFWHTSSHIMAYAISRLYPDAKFAIGPAIDNGFYYDIDLDHKLTQEDLPAILKEMKNIVKEGYEVEHIHMPRQEAIEFFKEKKQDYKLELIEELEDEEISIYKIGDYYDLCKGPHLDNVKKVKAIELLSIAGAYWRGDEKNKMLQRIYGISFEKKKLLDEYLERLEEAEKRDHRKLGKELDLFTMHEEGPGFPFFHPNGMILRNQLLNWWRDVLNERGYGEILTPIVLNEEL